MNTFQTLTNNVTNKRLMLVLLASLFVMPLTLAARDPGLNQPGAVGGVGAPAAALATPAGVGRVGGVGAPAAALATPAGVGHVGGVGAPAAALATPAGVGHVGSSARQVRLGVR